MESDAPFLPIQPAISQERTRLAALIGYQPLVTELVNPARHRGSPVFHQAAVCDVVPRNLTEIVRKWITVFEQGFIHRVAYGHRMPSDMDDLRARYSPADQAAIEVIQRHLVDETTGAATERRAG